MNALALAEPAHAVTTTTIPIETGVWWAVADGRGNKPIFVANERAAYAQAIAWDASYPMLAPHRVLRMVEQPL